MICGRHFSFITIASIGFLKCFTTDFLHFKVCILPSIIRHILLHRGIRGTAIFVYWRRTKINICLLEQNWVKTNKRTVLRTLRTDFLAWLRFVVLTFRALCNAGRVDTIHVLHTTLETLRFFVFERTKHQPRRNLRSYLVLQRLCNEAALSPGIDAFWY